MLVAAAPLGRFLVGGFLAVHGNHQDQQIALGLCSDSRLRLVAVSGECQGPTVLQGGRIRAKKRQVAPTTEPCSVEMEYVGTSVGGAGQSPSRGQDRSS